MNQDNSGMLVSNIKHNKVAPAVAVAGGVPEILESKEAVAVKVQHVLTDAESASQIELADMKPRLNGSAVALDVKNTPWKKQPSRQSTRRGNKVGAKPKSK